ncbi:pilus assembly protein [Kangiella shandongensis]|uniref:pilus assembly protein n=1 Tax=Kangiella shandongensis TaxID=2763258 RepID=UPI001CBC950B|nr:hypothetical protein [Kangiella shandongensis]
MKNIFSSLMKGVLLGLYLTIPLMTSTTAHADDTEVYFFDGDKIESGKSKVMLLLESSSAMNGGGRMAKIQEALKLLAKDDEVTASADFGIAVFNKENSGPGKAEGTVQFPIATNNTTPSSPTYDSVVDRLANASPDKGATPTVEGMSEAYRYFLSREPYYWDDEFATSGKTHPDAVSEGRYDFNDTSGCAAKALIVLAHGQINGKEWRNAASSIVGRDSTDIEMVSYMKGNHSVETYTISPGSSGNNKANLDAWADAGGTEQAFEWNDTAECFATDADGNPVGLCAILKDIFQEVASQGTSFVQAGVTVSQQNRLNHDNHLYFAQFQAEDIARWPGNLKKYKISGGEILDVENKSAVDPNTGLFLEERDANGFITRSTSFWPKKDEAGNIILHDGNQVELGGALEHVSNYLDEAVTEVTAGDGSVHNVLNEYNAYGRPLFSDSSGSMYKVINAGKADFAMGGATDDEFYWVKDRTLGFKRRDVTITHDNGDEETISNVASSARLMGDPLHSVPKVVQYGNGKSLVFVGTNLGYLHAVDLSTGVEEWGYIPNDLLTKMQTYMKDEEIGGDPTLHNYGLDGEIHIAHGDTNGNLKVDDGEIALLLVGMRRGGDKYYVLDISNSSVPEFKFDIDPSDDGLSNLADTWSTATVTNITYGGDTRTVAIFGGGYDDNQDSSFSKDTEGNDVFIYDLKSQTVLWSLQDSGLTEVKGQINSVPANVRAISLDNNSTVEHLYVTDTAGQVFRFDLYNTDTGIEVKGGRILEVSSSTEAENRRFYYAPSVAYIPQPSGQSYMAVALGSGYRAHPLDTKVQDYFFMLKDKGILQTPKTFKDVTFTPGVADGPLVDVTSNVSGSASVPPEKDGWYIKLNSELTVVNDDGTQTTTAYDGEKVIAEARILFGKIVFTSYVPTVDLTKLQCAPVIGSGKIYGVNVDDGSSFFSDDTRSISLISDGIPPIFQLLFTTGASSDGSEADFIGLVGNEVISDAFTEALTKGYDGVIRVNWRKKPDDN